MSEPPAVWLRPMIGRDRDEEHRASTPLELLFDLCFVVAVAQAAAELHHGVAAGHFASAVLSYLMVFFAIWWAWVNFTWFASAYDTDDVAYRLLTMLQIVGVLVLAAGVPTAFEHHDFVAATFGYLIMRVAMVAQWIRVAAQDRDGRPAALRYATGVGVVQVCWLLRLLLPDPWSGVGFAVLVAAEICVPLWAEYRGRMTTWHPDHINERYGLFTLIVLGECVSAATVGIQSGIRTGGLSAPLFGVATGGLLLVFGVWWSYFKHEAAPALRQSLTTTVIWAYNHYLIFASVAALGAGLQVAVDADRHISALATGFAVVLPIAVYQLVLGRLHAFLRTESRGDRLLVLISVVLLVAAAFLAPAAVWASVLAAGAVVAGTVALYLANRRNA